MQTICSTPMGLTMQLILKYGIVPVKKSVKMKNPKNINVFAPKQLSVYGLSLILLTVLFWPVTVNAQPECNQTGTPAQLEACLQANPIVNRLEGIINFLSAGVAVVVVAVIIWGGIQYMTAGGDPKATADAKSKITNALIALLAFIFTYAFLQWLVPGGVFG